MGLEKSLGCFETEAEAKVAYQNAKKELHKIGKIMEQCANTQALNNYEREIEAEKEKDMRFLEILSNLKNICNEK